MDELHAAWQTALTTCESVANMILSSTEIATVPFLLSKTSKAFRYQSSCF